MRLERLALGIACALIALYALGWVVGAVAMGPWGVLVLIPLAVAAYFLWRVVRERGDDRYDRMEGDE